jgi:hypothetical protein
MKIHVCVMNIISYTCLCVYMGLGTLVPLFILLTNMPIIESGCNQNVEIRKNKLGENIAS